MPKIQTAQHWEPLFRDFIGQMSIDSKETGITKLTADNIYGAQNRFLSEVCAGLDAGIRDFKCLKARQLGVTTITLPIDLFWLYVHPGLQGGLVTDTEGNREKIRIILERLINSLPKGMRVGIKKHNRSNLVLNNGSVLDYLVAGTKKGGGLGRSRAFNFLHATEVSSYGDPEGMQSLIATLAQTHPDRLYIYESTARGFNLFWDLCQDAKSDALTQKLFFIGWWAKEIYSFPKNSPEYKEYWDGELTDEEREKVNLVREKYGVKMRSTQIAWYRWMQSSKMSAEMMSSEYPWTEEEAFVATGQAFFAQRRVANDMQFLADAAAPYKAYRYHMGDQFIDTDIEQVHRPDLADLRVWEEPHPNGVYAIGMDPAFGRSDHKDRHAIQVCRAYADKVVQVAEYATPDPETYKAAWVLAHLAGSYKNCIINLEINGPGTLIMDELRNVRNIMDAAHMQDKVANRGWLDVFNQMRWYLYHRADSLGAGYMLNFKTTADSKLRLLNLFRDSYNTGQLMVRSMLLLEEMQKIVQDGGDISASGRNKDDRAFAFALAILAWSDWLRPSLIAENRIYARVTEDEIRAQTEDGRSTNMVENIVVNFFKQKEIERVDRQIQKMWANPDFIGMER